MPKIEREWSTTMYHAVLSVVVVVVVVFFQAQVEAQQYYDFRCSDNYTSGAYQLNRDAAFRNLTTEAALSNNFIGSYGDAPTTVHSGYFCRGDVPLALCHYCLGNSTKQIAQFCPEQVAGIIWYDLCTLGYSPEPFLAKFVAYYEITFRSNQNVTGVDVAGFNRLVNTTVEEVAEAAAEDGAHRSKFATREANFSGGGGAIRLYTLAQCSSLLDRGECRKCLSAGIQLLPGCCSGRTGGRVLISSCNLRYETFPFYGLIDGESVADGISEGGKHVAGIVGGIVGGGVCMLLLLATFLVVLCRRNTTQTSSHRANKAEMNEITSADSLQFDFNKIRTATGNFSSANKLGQGGFGVVYKGILDNGQQVAVKRLSETSGQGIEEFKTEVVLVAKLQHRNLVKLLGFCFSEKEKLLVYEYLSNSSLDKFLSEPQKQVSLDWTTRFNIICGIARGLLYLHEDSRLKIIHRDLKSSNILLDEEMSPKISDFGLAKLFGVDQTQDDTNRIVGTYGYMAPEYALAGHFSVKSDVYSFGIIVLEIVSGQKNRFFSRPQEEEALQIRAWKFWNDGVPLELADPSLSKKYLSEEVIRCIQIGLLCIQDSASNRPNMTLVMAALNGQSMTLAQPLPPNFLTSSTSTSTTGMFTSGGTSHTTSDYSGSTARKKQLFVNDSLDYTATTDITEICPR